MATRFADTPAVYQASATVNVKEAPAGGLQPGQLFLDGDGELRRVYRTDDKRDGWGTRVAVLVWGTDGWGGWYHPEHPVPVVYLG